VRTVSDRRSESSYLQTYLGGYGIGPMAVRPEAGPSTRENLAPTADRQIVPITELGGFVVRRPVGGDAAT